MRPKVMVDEIKETWYRKDDPNKRYPQTTKRLKINFPYDADVQNQLKNALRSIEGYYNLKFSDGDWSLRSDRSVINKAVEILQPHYDTYFLEQYGKMLPEKKNTGGNKQVSATIVRGEIELAWPYIPDVDLRDTVRNTVKSIPNRSWNNANKTWRIPIAEASLLVSKLDGVYDPLKTAIESIPEVESYMGDLAQRIAISDAPVLNDEETIVEMKSRLSEFFPPHLELYPFQYVGVKFAELAGGRCLIGDDMGIGKTIQAIAYAALHKEQWPVIVVCPAGVKYNWANEINRWLPDASVEIVNGFTGDIKPADFVIVNYDLMSRRKEQLQNMKFNLSIIDESHYLKNKKAKRTSATLEIAKETEGVLCLSGTAITSRPEEYFTTLNLIRSSQFSSWLKYVRRYAGAYHDGWGWNTGGATNTEELHNLTRDFTIRRLKKEVMSELPDKIRQPFFVNPSTQDYSKYKEIQRGWMDIYTSHKSGGIPLPAGFVLNMLTELRHECGKIKVKPAIDWVIEYKEQHEKPILIFAHHKDVIKSLVDGMNDQLQVEKIDGDVSPKRRQEIVDSFQGGNIDVLICSMAAKEGLTLTKADTVVFIERQWVSSWEEQAEDRINRIGQDADTVHAIYFTVKGTIDERFHRLIEEKRDVVKAILDGGDTEQRKGITKTLLKEMVADGEIPASFLEDV